MVFVGLDDTWMDIDSGDLDLDLVASLDFLEIEDLVGLVVAEGAGLDDAT